MEYLGNVLSNPATFLHILMLFLMLGGGLQESPGMFTSTRDRSSTSETLKFELVLMESWRSRLFLGDCPDGAYGFLSGIIPKLPALRIQDCACSVCAIDTYRYCIPLHPGNPTVWLFTGGKTP